ncbi:ShlB/FhaC/HecB family hemolysin secretion/activation protein [Pelomonas sp. UHG3]|jgi:hemolysin activation/secretion protein|uniref:ShlB/FhaC/HecB family hemolysin secretion/activation protein n=2 Tax=Roseateles hydrophilus TaxID=2975054 RepID=A0ACC6C8P5_9BURK|nr:ShlB/FhaC/HecB family hemolysin secretion/activation protein [Pelomonas sp. UHG3]
MTSPKRLVLGLGGLLLIAASWAQDRKDVLDAIERERLQQIRDAQLRVTPQLAGARGGVWLDPVEGEAPCFHVQRVHFRGAPPGFADEHQDLRSYAGACLGALSIERLRQNLQARLVDLGYVTSHITVPPQNLADGVLQLDVELGRVGRIERRGGARAIGRNALALRTGNVLNLRDIEQSLENTSRLPSQAAQVQIEAADVSGESVLVLAATERRSWRMTVGADNAGASDYGSLQGSAQLVLDGPLGLSDQLVAYVAGAPKRGAPFQRSGMLSYSLPFGYHLLSVTGTRSEHNRLIQGLSTVFSENGHDASWQLRWQWTPWRSASGRVAVWLGASDRRSRNHIDDVELVLQRRNVRTTDWGFSGWWRREAGEFQLDYEQAVSTRRTLGADVVLDPPPLARTARAQLGWQRPFGDWRYDARLAWSGVHDAASGADLHVLGSRWTVRGFDARSLLSGKEQISLKQDLRGPGVELPAGVAWQPYAGLDVGRIAGAFSGGRTLAGATVGVRVQFGGLFGDLAAAAPLHKPQGFDAASAVVYASLNYSY